MELMSVHTLVLARMSTPAPPLCRARRSCTRTRDVGPLLSMWNPTERLLAVTTWRTSTSLLPTKKPSWLLMQTTSLMRWSTDVLVPMLTAECPVPLPSAKTLRTRMKSPPAPRPPPRLFSRRRSRTSQLLQTPVDRAASGPVTVPPRTSRFRRRLNGASVTVTPAAMPVASNVPSTHTGPNGWLTESSVERLAEDGGLESAAPGATTNDVIGWSMMKRFCWFARIAKMVLLEPVALRMRPDTVGTTNGLAHQTDDALLTVMTPFETETPFGRNAGGFGEKSMRSVSPFPALRPTERARTAPACTSHCQSNAPSVSVTVTPAQLVSAGAEKTRSSLRCRHASARVDCAAMKLQGTPDAERASAPSFRIHSFHSGAPADG